MRIQDTVPKAPKLTLLDDFVLVEESLASKKAEQQGFEDFHGAIQDFVLFSGEEETDVDFPLFEPCLQITTKRF